MLNLTKLHWHHLILNISMLLLLMHHSHIKQIRTSTFVLWKLLIQVSTSREKRELVMEVTMPLWFFMPRDSKIFQLLPELEMLLEYTEPLLDSTTIKDNSTLVFSTTVHGPSSLLKVMKIVPLLILARTTVLKSMKLLYYQTSENGQLNISLLTMSLLVICLFPWTKYKMRKLTLMF